MDFQFSPSDIYLDAAVKECPHCHNKISPIYLEHHRRSFENNIDVYDVICQCPSCYNVFFAEYSGEVFQVYANIEDFNLKQCNIYPVMPNNNKFNNYIKNLSPQFIEIYSQAEIAELSNLNEIAGIGYRKAFEFLVKDYAIYKEPLDEQAIKTDWLAKVLKERISYEPLSQLADRVNWLGTDHGHYYRKYAEYDIEDLKYCIDTFISWIELLENTKKIVNTIEKR